MLTLSRKVNETIRIGNDIEIRIKRIEGEIVKIGIEAPAHIAILRGELFAEVRESNLGAAEGADATAAVAALRALQPGQAGDESVK